MSEKIKMPSFDNHRNQDEKTPENAIENKDSKIYLDAKDTLGEIFDGNPSGEERVAKIMEKIEPLLQYLDREIITDEEIERIRGAVSECGEIEDKGIFLSKAMEILDPILQIADKRPDKFEEAQAKQENARKGFTEINRLISYGKSGPTLHMHHSLGRTVKRKRPYYQDAMKKLALIVAADPKIKRITATSWIVEENPGLFKMSGFDIGEVSDELRAAHFSDAERLIKEASIDREKFLSRFLE
jgi:vacuolar-type H+-ATPase subunit I/STV1